MAHQHSVYDVDTHFKIDAVSRKITSEAGAKTTLMQYDHNSERFTFEMPRYIEGHDMLLTTKAEVHYLNISTANKADQVSGVYEIDDLQISPAADDVVICSWLISQNATGFAGPLVFILRFVCCSEGGVLDYVWSTDKYESITISDGIYNSEIIIEQYADVLEQWSAGIDLAMTNPYYTEAVKLKGITTAVPDWEDASAYITDNSIGSACADFIIDIQGEVKFNSSCVGEPEHTADFYIDGELVAQCSDGGSFTFEGHVSQNIRVHCTFMDVYFIEFIKKVYLLDVVSDIDTALDSILAIQESIIGGVEL